MEDKSIERSEIEITCSDGVTLAGTIYRPETPRAAVLIAPATGIKRRFYNSVATHLAEEHYGVICFDYRGIGDSKMGSINAVNASLENWGRLDMTAALEVLMTNFPKRTYHLLGHSAGGQLVGLMDNCHALTSIVNVAASSGSLRNMKYPFKVAANFYLNVFIPVSNFLFGQTNSQWVGMGEPLPRIVAAQWRRWCNGSGYVATDFGTQIQSHNYEDLTLPILWLYATDDGIAIEENVHEMAQVYARAQSEFVALDPKTLGFIDIGHMKFFSSKRKVLWNYALGWLDVNA